MIKIIKVTNCIWRNVNHTQRLSASALCFSTSNVKGNIPISLYISVHSLIMNIYRKPLFLDRYYTEKHEWIDVKDNIGTIGISDYAQVTIQKMIYIINI